MKLQDFINSKNITLYMKELPTEQSVDKALFPAVKQLGTDLEFAKGAKKKAVALRMSQFDVAAKTRALSASLNVEKREIPFFKESLPLKESDRRDLINAANSNNENLVKALAGQVFENYANLIEGANIVAKRMRCELIQKGELKITTDDGDIVVDYGVPSGHKNDNVSPKWNVASTDIVADIKKFQKAITDDGYTKPTTLLMTEKTFADTIMANTAITAHLKSGANVKNLILNEQDYINFLKDRMGLSVVFLENSTFIPAEGEEAQPYYLDGYVTLISGNTLGRTVYGTTPEEWDKVYGSSKLDTDIYDLAIAITTMVKEDPVTIDTKVSQLVIPSFERADEVYFAKVY